MKSATQSQKAGITEVYGVGCDEILDALRNEELRNAKKAAYYRRRRQES